MAVRNEDSIAKVLNKMAKVAIFIFAFFILCLAVFNFVFIKTPVKGSSMYPTLNSNVKEIGTLGDTVYINRFSHGAVGDIVVAEAESWVNNENSKYIIKRLIGLAGDEITIKKVADKNELDIMSNNEVVYSFQYTGSAYDVYSYMNFLCYVSRNIDDEDRVIDKEYLYFDTYLNMAIYTGTIKLFDGEAFIMGDNMLVSHDCAIEGPISVSQIIGRVDIVLDCEKSSNFDLLISVFKLIFHIS